MQIDEAVEIEYENFDPASYLREYYASIDYENDQLLQFFHSSYREGGLISHPTVLEFSSGPTLYSLITAATRASTIHISDKLEANLREIQLWKRGDGKAFNWEPFIRRALEIEGTKDVTQEDIQERMQLMRRKLTLFGFCDAFRTPPLSGNLNRAYDIVQVNFVPESITSSLVEWEDAIKNILSLLKPQGTFLLTALKDAVYYQLQRKRFAAVSVDERLLMHTLTKYGFKEADVQIQSIPANPPYRGYSGIIFVKAQRMK